MGVVSENLFKRNRLELYLQRFSLFLMLRRGKKLHFKKGAEKEDELGALGQQRAATQSWSVVAYLWISCSIGGKAIQKICILNRYQSGFLLFADESKALLINTVIFLSPFLLSSLSPFSFHVILFLSFELGFNSPFLFFSSSCLICYFSLKYGRINDLFI